MGSCGRRGKLLGASVRPGQGQPSRGCCSLGQVLCMRGEHLRSRLESHAHSPGLTLLLCLGLAVVLVGSQVGASSPGASSPTETHMGWTDI